MNNENEDFNALAASGTVEFVDWLGARVKQVLSDMVKRHRLREEIAELESRGSLDYLLADVGVSRGELAAVIAGHPESSRLLRTMAQRLGVDVDHIADAAIRHELQRSCAVCGEHRRCRSWLVSGDAGEQREFCPNAEMFERFRGEAELSGSKPDHHRVIPGTPVFDGERAQKGYALNKMCFSFNSAENRARFLADEDGYCTEFGLSPAQREAVGHRSIAEMIEVGGNIYYLAKLAGIFGMGVQDIGAQQTGMTVEAFKTKLAAAGT